MLKEIVFATNNKHKLQELQQIIGDKFNLVSLKDIKCHEDIPETGNTIEDNSMQKVDYISNNYNKDCFADDTGLEIEALNGRPGVHSARYAGDNKNMQDNIAKVLSELKGKNNRNARFKTVVSLIMDGKKHQFEGIVEGKIIEEERGTGGFGYDPIFMPKGYDITFAEMTADEKNKISHRGKAVAKLVEFLSK